MKSIHSRFQLLVAMLIVGLVMAQPESASGQIYVDFKDGPIRMSDREVTVGSIAKVDGSPQRLVKEISAVVVDSFDGADMLSIDQLKVAIRVSLAGYQDEKILFNGSSRVKAVLVKQRDQRVEFEQAFARYLSSQYSIPNSEIKVSLDPKTSLPGNAVDFSSMTVNDVMSPEFPLGNHKYSISTFSDSGASVSFGVNVQTVMYRKLAVAKRDIPQGTKITRDHVSGVLRPISSPQQVFLTVDQVLGSTVRIGVNQYGLIKPNEVHRVEEFLVRKNSYVDAVLSRRGFHVTLRNLRTSSNGNEGDRIQLINPHSGETMMGVVVNSSTVKLF
ncbi:MAG: flagellar basal body P-ring formation chaperone FlgA [Planctomycetota bacterium]